MYQKFLSQFSILSVVRSYMYTVDILVLYPRHISEQAQDNTINLIHTLRNYLHYHIKCSKVCLYCWTITLNTGILMRTYVFAFIILRGLRFGTWYIFLTPIKYTPSFTQFVTFMEHFIQSQINWSQTANICAICLI